METKMENKLETLSMVLDILFETDQIGSLYGVDLFTIPVDFKIKNNKKEKGVC